jgi:prepilin-type N-terminal cleavage/methylation domain-containing protein
VEMIRPLKRINRKGFTLVEVVMAVMIGTVGLLALAGLLVKVMTTNRMATDISIATALARQKIEQIKLTDYNYVQSELESNLDENGNVISGGKYTRITQVTENAAAFNTKTVDVAVYFSPSMQDTIKKAVVSTIIYP